MELEAYRHDAEAFLEALTREYYRHFAGLQQDYAIEPIYDRYRHLFQRDAVTRLRERAGACAAASEEGRRLRLLLDFAVDGYVGELTKQAEAELARREAATEVAVEGERLAFREVPARQANEPDRERRAQLEGARCLVLSQKLEPLYRELVEGQHAAARELGWPSYREMCAEIKGVDLQALSARTAEFQRKSTEAYPRLLRPHAQRALGLGLGELARSDLPRLLRAPEFDAAFPAVRLLASHTETLRDLGLDPTAQPGLTLDVAARAGKSPRAFCAPVRTPGEVYLVIAPVGGRDDFGALFHESGHAQHATNTDPALPFEFRCLGDNAISEAYAFLIQHLIEDPEWLRLRLGVSDASEMVAYARAERLLYVRRYCAKLAYELELHGPGGRPGELLAARYAQLLEEALGMRWPSESYLADVDSGFYSTCYLRAWAMETQLRVHLRERHGAAWFTRPEAGAELRRLWSQGQRHTPEELLAEVTGHELSFEPLLSELTAA